MDETKAAFAAKVSVGEKRGVPCNLHYEVYGSESAPNKLLFIHGLLTSGRAWMEQIIFFRSKEFKDDIQFCIFDNRGIGFSDVPRSGYSTSNMAMDALELVDHLGWERFHLVGLSMGGMIAVELALHALDRVASLTLAVTHSGGLSGIAPFTGLHMLARISLLKTAEEKAPTCMKMWYSNAFLDASHDHQATIVPDIQQEDDSDAKVCTCTGKNHDRMVQQYVKRINEEPIISIVAVFGQLKACITHYVSTDRLAKLRDSGIPILIMTGTFDHLVRPSNSHSLNEALRAVEFKVFENAGHLINDECAHEFNHAVLRNIRRATR